MTSFTFHNVSINTRGMWMVELAELPLHSTMFLLILLPADLTYNLDFVFTFHNVSINTRAGEDYRKFISATLHSTMFLLIL